MKKTLKQDLGHELEAINKRIEMLKTNIEEYVSENRLGDAAINQVKYDVLKLVSERLTQLLKNH